MALDKLMIGTHIRTIRENIFHETRSCFADRCQLKESHIGQIERGEILVSLVSLDKIASATGTDVDYLLYGKGSNKNLEMRKNIDNYLNHSSKEELKMYFKCISSIKNFVFASKFKK